MEYAAWFEPADEGGFVVTFPDVEGAITQGEDEQDAREMARDALITMIAYLIRSGKEVPIPRTKGRKYRMIQLPALVALKTALHLAFRTSGLTKAALGRRLGIPKSNVDRLFDLRNHTRLDQLEAAFAALGKQLALEVKDAA
jgi:antitoxin HicB